MGSLSKLSEIVTGWRNYIIENPVTEREAKRRSKICSCCEHAEKSGILVLIVKDNIKEIQGYKCDICDCPLSAKIRSNESKCEFPNNNKWQAE